MTPITAQQLAAAARISMPLAERWVDPMNRAMAAFEINTQKRIAAFIAQCGHESMGFTRLEEDMNYSVSRLMAVWPARFKSVQLAAMYAHNPEALANFVYANRNGNGDEDSGDGWRYRGRGLIQITGRDNYAAASMALFASTPLGAERLLQLTGHVAEDDLTAAATAAEYWRRNGLNERADAGEFEAIGNLINTGRANRQAHGTDDRLARTNIAMEALA